MIEIAGALMDKNKFNSLLQNYKTDQRAFTELYDYYFHRIVFHVTWKFGRDISEDVAQEFFMKLMRITLDEPVENPTSWVYTVCDNLAKTVIKKQKPYDELTGEEFYEFSSDVGERETIQNALKVLDETDEKIVLMYYWEGYSLKEIASILHLPYETVKKRHPRALKKMQKILKNLSL